MTNDTLHNLHFAPVQGHTDAPYRHFHAEEYGAAPAYYTPFIRLEHGALRRRDLADFTSPLNEGLHVVPQIIFRDEAELTELTRLLTEAGATEIDLNMGCPFPLQTGHGRGAATVADDALGDAVARLTHARPDVTFTLKMRLGFESPEEWRTLLPHLNDARLAHVAVHPRVARQQYGGELDMVQWGRLLAEVRHPVIFNGEIKTPADARSIAELYPAAAGLMMGRGALGRPSLLAEIAEGREWTDDERRQKMMHFHRRLFEHYRDTLCGDAQVLSKIQPFWEYAEAEIGRKVWKAVRKATTLPRYTSALAQLS